MAAIRAGMLNQGLGQFHGGAYYRNSNYHNNNKYQDEFERADSISDSDSENSSARNLQENNKQESYIVRMLAIEKHKRTMERKQADIERIEKILRLFDTLIVVLGAFGTGIAQYEAQTYYDNGNSPTRYSNGLRVLVTISTVVLLVLIIIHSKYDYQILKNKREALEEDVEGFFLCKNFKILLLEVVINAIHCPPGLNHAFVSQQLGGTLTMSLNQICACIMLLRVYLIAKLFRHFTKWTSQEAQHACRLYETEPSPIFAVKAMLKEKPFYLLVPSILLSMLVFSLSVMIVERGFYIENTSMDYGYLWNSMWLVMLTMTTVGYGDFYPRTHFGRFIIVLSCFWGIFIISLMVVTMTNFILFSSEEARSFDYMKKVKSMSLSKKYARLYIRAQLTRYLYYRNHKGDPITPKMHNELSLQIKFYYKRYKEYQDEARFADIGAAEMLTVLNERISLQVKTINRHLQNAHKVHENLSIALSCQEKVKESLDDSITYLQKLKRLLIS